MAVSNKKVFDMRAASHCFIFLILLIAVRTFPQNVIPSVTESSTILDSDIVPAEGVQSEISIPQEPEVVVEEVAVSSTPNEEKTSEVPLVQNAEVNARNGEEGSAVVSTVPISQNTEAAAANETVAPTAPNEGTTSEASVVEGYEPIVVSTNQGNIDDARLIAFEDYSIPSALADIDTVNEVQKETVLESFTLRSLIPSSTTAASGDAVDSTAILASAEPVAEVVTEVPASSTSSSEVFVSSTSTEVPESSSVVSAPEAPVSSIPEVSTEPEAPKFGSDGQTPEVLGRSVLTDFPDIEVIIPLVDVSLPAISGRSLDPEPVSTAATVSDFASNISSSSVESVSSTTEVPAPLSSPSSVVADVEPVVLPDQSESIAPANNVVVPDSTIVSPNFEVPQESFPADFLRTLDAESPTPLASDSTVSTTISDSESNSSSPIIESGSSTTEVLASASSSVIPEIESVALANDSSVPASSTEIPDDSLSKVSPKSFDAESATTSIPELVSESVSSTTSAPVPESSTEVLGIEIVLPLTGVFPAEDSLRSVKPVEASTNAVETEPVSSTTAAAEVSSSESDVISSTEASVAIDSTTVVTTETSVSTQTGSVPSPPRCRKAGNYTYAYDCRMYYSCSIDLLGTREECPDRHVYSPVLKRCSRDISPCFNAGPACLRPGSIADPNTSSAYYWCASSLLGGFHKYHVRCDFNEVYVSSISRCLPEALHHSQKGVDSDFRSDRDIVKAEWKILKKELKHQAKEDKNRQKLEAKAKAHAEKLATKNLKKQKGDTKKHDESDDDDEDEDED